MFFTNLWVRLIIYKLMQYSPLWICWPFFMYHIKEMIFDWVSPRLSLCFLIHQSQQQRLILIGCIPTKIKFTFQWISHVVACPRPHSRTGINLANQSVMCSALLLNTIPENWGAIHLIWHCTVIQSYYCTRFKLIKAAAGCVCGCMWQREWEWMKRREWICSAISDTYTTNDVILNLIFCCDGHINNGGVLLWGTATTRVQK